jgi:protein FrlC
MNKLTMDNVAAMSIQYWHYSFDYFINSMVQCGIRNVELWPGEPHYYREDFRSSGDAAKRIRELRRKMDDAGLQVIMYTPDTLGYPYNPAAFDEAYRNRTIDMYKHAVEDLLEFGTNQMFCNPGWGLLDKPRETAWAYAVDTIRRICEYAGKMGVTLNIEQLQPYESNLIITAADMEQFLQDVGADNLVCCLDIGAMAVAKDTIDDFYRRFPDKIGHVHFSDLNHEVPGDRGLPLKDYIATFNRYGYTGYLTLEVNDTIYINDPHEAFMRAAAYMRTLLA